MLLHLLGRSGVTSGAAYIEEFAIRPEEEGALPAADPAKALEQFKLEQELELAVATARAEGRKVDAP